ncbi:MAG: lysine--tRNA ligase [Candidatus Babeliales bacterium]
MAIKKIDIDALSEHIHGKTHISDEHKVRIEKVKKLREIGYEPWPMSKEVSALAHEITEKYQEGQEQEYQIAGRILGVRGHGKTVFAHIQDQSGKIQIYLREDMVGSEQFDFFTHYIDIGDIVWLEGQAFRTKMGEVTLKVKKFTLLSKCLHPLPEKFHGLTDIQTRYRQRYLDLITNPESREKFLKRSKIISSMRHFLENHGYIEVETPMLHPIPGGAAAKPFVTHHNALASDFYLRIAPELYLKRLVVGGFDRVFEINRNFRNEGISTRHNPEFTMVEFYTAHKDYYWAMDFVESLIRSIVKEACNTLTVPFGDYTLDFSKPFIRMSIYDSVKQYGGLTDDDLTPKKIDGILAQKSISLAKKNASIAEKIFLLFEALVEHQLIQPTFITDFPVEISPLAKRDPEKEGITSRFELFMAGMELANGFNELNDPHDQATRFLEQAASHAQGDDEAHRFDADFIIALEHGLPPTVGVGIGVDRLAMIATNTTSIKDVILFPTLKKLHE